MLILTYKPKKITITKNREGYLQGKLKNALVDIKATIKINFILSRFHCQPQY